MKQIYFDFNHTNPNKGVYLELVDNKHFKFYELVVEELRIKISYGRIGRAGKLITLVTPNNNEALKLFMKKLQAKLKKGYKKTIKGLTPTKVKGVHPQQLTFEFYKYL